MDITNDTTIDTEPQEIENTEVEVTPPENTKPPSTHDTVTAALDQLQNAAKEPQVKPVTVTPAAAVAAAAPRVDDIDPISGKTLEPIKAPSSLPVMLREEWKGLPRKWQQYYSKRELDLEQNLSRSGEARKFTEAMRKAAEPMEPVLKAWNMNLEQAATRLFQEAHVLTAGNAQQKAAFIGNLIHQYQPDANVLKAVLSGQNVNVPMQVQRPPDIEAEVNKRLAQRTQQDAEAQANSAWEQFYSDPSNEFARDLEAPITAVITGQLIPTAGKTYDQILKDAYEFAVKNSPEIQEVLKLRGGQAAPAAAATATQAVKPVRSAKPALGAGKVTAAPAKKFKTSKEAAMAAWDALKS